MLKRYGLAWRIREALRSRRPEHVQRFREGPYRVPADLRERIHREWMEFAGGVPWRWIPSRRLQLRLFALLGVPDDLYRAVEESREAQRDVVAGWRPDID